MGVKVSVVSVWVKICVRLSNVCVNWIVKIKSVVMMVVREVVEFVLW